MGNPLVMGIDAGGTRVRILVADAETGKPVVERELPARPDGGPDDLHEPIASALADAGIVPLQVHAVCAGITKISRAGIQDRWEAALGDAFPAAQRLVVPDFVIAFEGATGGRGVAMIAGTGSVAYGEDGRGGTARAGGRGWEWGDEGSGAWITGEMLRQTLRALDGLGETTPLTDAVCDHLQTQDAARLGEMARARSANEGRGFLAPLALERAQRGDEEARDLFVGAAGWLAAHVRAVANRLDFSGPAAGPVVAMVGGLWEAGDLLVTPFRTVVQRWLPGAQVCPARETPVQGAVARALRSRR